MSEPAQSGAVSRGQARDEGTLRRSRSGAAWGAGLAGTALVMLFVVFGVAAYAVVPRADVLVFAALGSCLSVPLLLAPGAFSKA